MYFFVPPLRYRSFLPLNPLPLNSLNGTSPNGGTDGGNPSSLVIANAVKQSPIQLINLVYWRPLRISQ
jgi:hypothetical protein